MKMRKKLHERIEVIFEDQDAIVIEKAAGVLSYPVEGRDEESAIRLIRRYWKFRNNKQNQLYLLHRLDKETSGVMIFAKSSVGRESLRRQFEEHTVIRGYLAVTDGIPNQKSGTIKTFLGRNQRGRRVVAHQGKAAITRYQVLFMDAENRRALVRCYLHTGRTHQVRIHMAHLNAPVIGDVVYGNPGSGRMALHAEVLGFIHPRTGIPLVLRSSLPVELRQLLSRRNGVNFKPGSLR